VIDIPPVSCGPEIAWTVNGHTVRITHGNGRTYARITCSDHQTNYLLITDRTGMTLPPCPLCDAAIARPIGGHVC
jgi:hypothetical protein